MALTVAQKVSGVVMTSLPGSRQAAAMLTWSTAIRELTEGSWEA
jgi:hypothetical protein